MNLKEFKPSKKLIFLFIALFIVLTPLLNVFLVNQTYKSKIYLDSNSVPNNYAALVLGAGVDDNGQPSWFLRDRIITAVELYKAGKVKKLIMSGDNSIKTYNEPEVMIKLAEELGVPKKDLQPDFAGRRTYDSCWRAKNIFSQDKITIITQRFHMSRSLMICNELGIDSVGFVAQKYKYPNDYMNYLNFREILAINLSLFDVYIKSPRVIGGEKIEI